MAGLRTIEPINANNSLDYPIEVKMGKMGSFRASEVMVIFIGPIVLTVLVCLLISKWLVPSIVIWAMVVPRVLLSLKKNKPKSWMWDLLHRVGINWFYDFFTAGQHFPRPKSPRVFTGIRTRVRGTFSNVRGSNFIHNKPWHSTLGLPAIRVYLHKKGIMGPRITAIQRTGGATLMTRTYTPGKAPVPAHLRHALITLDENTGRPLVCEFTSAIAPAPMKMTHE